MEFLFECSTWYLTSKRSERDIDGVEHASKLKNVGQFFSSFCPIPFSLSRAIDDNNWIQFT